MNVGAIGAYAPISYISPYASSVAGVIKMGVDGITVMMPAMLLDGKKNIKQFKKQCKKIGRLRRFDTAISLSAMDMTTDQIKQAFKIVDKTKLKAITFIFGDVRLEDFREKISVINKYKRQHQCRPDEP